MENAAAEVQFTDEMKKEAFDAGVRAANAEVMFSIKRTGDMSWDEQVDKLFKKGGGLQRNDTLVAMRSTPDALTNLVSDRPFAIPTKVVTKAQSGKDSSHSVTDADIRSLGRALQSPVAIVYDKGRHSALFLTDITSEGKPLVTTFALDRDFDGDAVHTATSIHYRQNLAGYLENLKDATIIVADEKKLASLSGKANILDRLQEGNKLVSEHRDSSAQAKKKNGSSDASSVSQSKPDVKQKKQVKAESEKARVEKAAAAYRDEETRALFASGAQKRGAGLENYQRAFDYFRAGGQNTTGTFEAFLSQGNNESMLKYIDKATAKAAFEQAQTAAKNATQPQRQAQKQDKDTQSKGRFKNNSGQATQLDGLFTAVAAKTGIDIEIQSEVWNGDMEANAKFIVKEGKIILSAEANSSPTDLMHELTHALAAYDVRKYSSLQKAIRDWYTASQGFSSYEAALNAIGEAYDGPRADLEEEFAAEAMAGLFSTEDGARQLVEWLETESGYSAEHKKSVLQKLGELLEGVINKILSAIRGGALSQTAKDAAAMDVKKARAMRKTLLDALAGIGKKAADSKGGEKFSIKYPKFTEAEIETNVRTLADMDVVYQVPAESLEKTGKRPRDIYDEAFARWENNIESEQFGDIALTNNSRKDDLGHGTTAEKLASIEAIPSVIQNGQVIFFRQKENGITERIVVAAPITIGEDNYYMGVMLQRDYQSQRLYLHNVVIEKETLNESPAHRVTTGSLDSNERFYITNILQNAINVKYEMRRAKENGTVKFSVKEDQLREKMGFSQIAQVNKSLYKQNSALIDISRAMFHEVHELQAELEGRAGVFTPNVNQVKRIGTRLFWR